MIFNAQGVPTPPSDIVERLQRIDERFGLKFLSLATTDQRMGGDVVTGADQYWAITLKWPQNDARRKMIAEGHMSPDDDFEILTFLPLDCSVDQAYGYLVNHLRQIRNRDDARWLLEHAAAYNTEVVREAKAQQLELAEELARANAPTLFNKEGKTITRVYQSGGKK